ncbi:hypothetical protein [Ancylobacter sp.]|uniref:hypothetical protein n=1 Tax=Ancylobacter sp. TaxID=1872567 RepID=UPI003D112BF5
MPIVLNCSADLARKLMTSPRPSYWGSLHAILIKAHDPAAGVYHWPRVAETDEMTGMGAPGPRHRTDGPSLGGAK